MAYNLRRVFDFLGLRDADNQRDLLEWLKASGAFDLKDLPSAIEASPENKASPLSVIVDPALIHVDAGTYQFRSGGDRQGVTSKGRYTTDHWDPILHGDPLLVHERLDGTLFVADGHHRLELAKRLNAQGRGPGAIAATVLREADGYTPLDVKIIAAYKNMAHGHANPVEAARVFKEALSGKVHTELLPSLQMDKGNLKISYTLSGLSDRALDQVEKDNIPIEVAARIAERAAGAGEQESLMQLIGNKIKQEYGQTGQPYRQIGAAPTLSAPQSHVAKLQLRRADLSSGRTLH
jgi:hypothetical protein